MIKNLFGKMQAVLASRAFFWAILGFFVFEALWFVFTAAYPMAFDEAFHVGVIKIYAGQWSPFLAQHPAGADVYGAIVRDPSYLFHYAMSFPYRLLHGLGLGETAIIIALRIINIGFFIGGILFFRNLMQRVRLSPAVINVSLAVFVLVPVVPMLAAHVNYDNLVFPITAMLCLLMLRSLEALQKRQIDVFALGWMLVLALLGSITKYAMLPLFVAAAVVLLASAGYYFRHALKDFWPALCSGFSAINLWMRWTLVALIIASAGLFAQRFVVNYVQYGTLVPSCEEALTVQQCQSFGPWARNYRMSHEKLQVDTSRTFYAGQWAWGMWFRSYFAVSGPDAGIGYITRRPLIVPGWTAAVVVVMGVLSVIVFARRIFWGNPFAIFLLVLILMYCVVLFNENYETYLETTRPVAVNGRYLIPLLLSIAILFAQGLSTALKRVPRAKTALAVLAILLFLHGGGVMTYILRSDSTWNWQNQASIKANDAARNILDPIIIKGNPI